MTEFGNSIKEYNVGEQLGKGGFAVVYRARCKNTGQEVAIKKINKGKIAAGGLINRVREEVTIHSKLNHPSILKLHTFFEDQEYVYLILELCLNGELQKYIKSLRRVLSEDEARDYLSQIVSGILHLHSHAIIHRDLTLSNLLLDNQGRIKIADFGLATQLRRPDDRHTTMCGTPNYISPEVATRSTHGLEADVWSLGCLLFIMLVGHPPFEAEGMKESIFTRVVIGDYKIPSYVSPNARSLISECLQKNERERIKLQSIPHHPFMVGDTKSDVSRMSDSGLYTMSTVTSTNHTRMPLSVISESNLSECENIKKFDHLTAKIQKEPLRKHPVSPPVRMKSSPRDLLPPNAGVIDNLKRKFTPLPSLRRGEDFAFSIPTVPSAAKRERDVSEERRKHQYLQYHREGSVSSGEDRSDSSHYSSSHISDDVSKHERKGLRRGGSEQNVMQYDHFERDVHSWRSHRSLERDYPNRDGNGSAEYGHKYWHQGATKHVGENSQSRSLDRMYGASLQQENISHERKVQEYGSKADDNARPSRRRDASSERDEESDYASSRVRSRSRNKSGDSAAHHREIETDRSRGDSRKHYREPPYDLYRDIAPERRRDRLQEPEHRSYREEHADGYKERCHSCCQNSQHTSCENRKNANEREQSNFDASNPNAYHYREDNQAVDKGQRVGCRKILGDIPPVKSIQESREDDGVANAVSRSQGTPTKKVSREVKQTIQQQVSPLCSKRLKATRYRAKNTICNVLDNGEVCLEFLSSKDGREKVMDVCRISSDGMRIVLYKPNGGIGSQVGDTPPPLPVEGTDSIFSYENLPQKYWKKYTYASRFVKVVKANTPKVTYYSDQAKCALMENAPDPDFEAVFYEGLKITSSGSDLKLKEVSGTLRTVPRTSAPRGLPESFHSFYFHFKEVRDHCLYLERVLTEVSEKSSLSCFPVIVGRKPPGVSTPPASARGNSQHILDDKENVPVSLQSFRSPGSTADRLGSFQESVASIQITGDHPQVPRRPFGSHALSNTEVGSPIVLKDPAPRVFIQDIGWATQGTNGVVSVEYLDGSQVLVSSNDPKVVFTDEMKVTKTYSTSNKLPLILQQKLSQMKIVLSSLAQPPRAQNSTSSSHRIGLR